jgi:hypothetical protein
MTLLLSAIEKSIIPPVMLRKVLIDIINNITGGIIDFSITDNESVMQVQF